MRWGLFFAALLPWPAAVFATTVGTYQEDNGAVKNNVGVVINGGTGTPTGTAGSPNAAVVTVQGISGGTPEQVQGNVASGAADSGNPVKTGCVAASAANPPTVSDTQRSDMRCNVAGGLFVEVVGHGNGVDAPNDTSAYTVYTANLPGNYQQHNGVPANAPHWWNGSVFYTGRGDGNGEVIQFGLSSTYWRYTSGTSPILSNTTAAVTIKAAAGASVRNYIDSCQFGSTALGGSVPLALRDGAGGTVMWASRPPLAGWLTPLVINFQPPLQGTANTLVEVVTTTADTSGTFDVNCQGHTGP